MLFIAAILTIIQCLTIKNRPRYGLSDILISSAVFDYEMNTFICRGKLKLATKQKQNKIQYYFLSLSPITSIEDDFIISA